MKQSFDFLPETVSGIELDAGLKKLYHHSADLVATLSEKSMGKHLVLWPCTSAYAQSLHISLKRLQIGIISPSDGPTRSMGNAIQLRRSPSLTLEYLHW